MSLFDKWTGAWSNVFGSVGSSLNKLTGVDSQMKKTYQQQMDAMGVQNAYNRYMWDLQNQYNSPVAQLARMREAGIDINPTSYALGTGNLSNTATFVGSENGFSGSGSPAGNPISTLVGMAQGIQGVRESQARTRNLGVQNNNLDVQNRISEWNLKYAKEHGLPVGTSPTWDTGLGSGLNSLGVWIKNHFGSATSKQVEKFTNKLSKDAVGSLVARAISKM